MSKQGARKVLATDASFHCYEKIVALKKYHKVDFDFQQTGSMYDLSKKPRRRGGFDYINLSGILYHVFPPLHVIASVPRSFEEERTDDCLHERCQPQILFHRVQ
jgi:hypothetical protein